MPKLSQVPTIKSESSSLEVRQEIEARQVSKLYSSAIFTFHVGGIFRNVASSVTCSRSRWVSHIWLGFCWKKNVWRAGTSSRVFLFSVAVAERHFGSLVTVQSRNITYYPPKSWSIYIPVSALCIFLATPILYATFNSWTVPRLDSMDVLKEVHTRQSFSHGNEIPARGLPPE